MRQIISLSLIIILCGACKTIFSSKHKYAETESGLKYTVVKSSEGTTPVLGDIVTIHYVAMLKDGTVFERTRAKNRPVSFRVGSNQVNEGLQEGVLMMSVGEIYRFVFPPEMAENERLPDIVKPYSELIYEVELLDVKPGIKIIKSEKKQIDKIETESGLIYAILESGKGKRAFTDMIIKAEYTGFFNDSLIFDSSFDRGKPLEVKLGDGTLIHGLEEGLTYLYEGDKARFWIPSELAYGSKGRGIIPPDTDLVFDIELLEVKEAEKPTPFDVADRDTLETESGLKYIIVYDGYGPKPKAGQIVEVHYSAYLKNGYMFDSSVQRMQPLRIIAGKGLMIKGWEEGIMLMSKKAKYRFIIPHHLAFGENSFGNVPRFATVIFDIEIIDIE